MAQKQVKGDKLSLDDYDFGSEFDFEEFDFTPKPVKNKREAVERIGSGVIEGVGDTLKSPSFIRSMIKKALPRGYGDMLDIVDQSASTMRELYNEGVKEVKPALKDLARATDKLMPSAEQYLPKSASALMKKFVDVNKEATATKVDPKNIADLAVADMLGETFKYNATQDAKRDAKTEVKERLEQTIAKDRHVDTMGQMEGIRRGVVQMAAYQSKVEYGFHRKSLELQMRHYFVAVDMLNEQRRQNVATTEHLAGILTNTGLPDYVKLRTSEKVKEMLRNKFLNNMQDRIFSARNNFIPKLGEALRVRAIDGVKSFASGVSDGAQGIEGLVDGTQQAGDMGVDKFKMAGNALGGMGAEWVGGLAGGRLKNKIGESNSKYGKKIRTVGNKLQFISQNAPQMAEDFANSSKDGKTYAEQMLGGKLGNKLSDTWKDRITSFLGFIGDPLLDLSRGSIKDATKMDKSVQQSGAADLTTPAIFNNKAHLSLTEIIPGYLARIYQELQITRTGDTSIDLPQYDFDRNAFSSTKTVRQAAFGKLFSKDAKEGVQREKDRLLELIDPEGKLTKEQRQILGQRLLDDNLGKRSGYATGKISNYTDAGRFGGEAEAPHGAKFAELFKNLEAKDHNNENKFSLDFSDRFANAGRSMGDNRALVQQLLETYPRDLLESMKILKPGSKKIDMEQMYRYFGGEEHQVKGVQAEGGLRPTPKMQPMAELPRTDNRAEEIGGNRQYGDMAIRAETKTGESIVNLKQLIDLLEQQNTKPLISDIKDILLLMKEELAQVERAGAGPSLMDQAGSMYTSASKMAQSALSQLSPYGQRLQKEALRAKRKALVAGGRAWNRRGEVTDAIQEFSEKHNLSDKAKTLREQAEEKYADMSAAGKKAWQNRPSLDDVKAKAKEHFEQAKTTAEQARNRIHQEYNSFKERRSEGTPDNEKSNSLLGDIKNILTAIQERLEDGILTQSMSEDGTLPKAKKERRSFGSRLNFRLSDVAKGMWTLGKKTASLGGGMVNSLLGGSAKLAYGLGKGAFNLAGGLAGTAINSQYRRARGFVDIYVGNEKTPRMYARMLQEGNVYFDQATGKPIRNLKMITGTVVQHNADGSERVVLEASEIEQAWCREGVVKKTLKSLGAVAKAAYGIGATITKGVLGGLPAVYRLGFMGLKKAFGLTDLAQDIFVKDKLTEPAMTARLMRAGSYHSAVSGKVITKPSMIDGPVVIGEGADAETVLTHDDIRKGLVDKNNRPIRTGWAKLANFAFGGVKKAWQLARKGVELGGAAVTSVAKTGWNALKKVSNVAVQVAGGGMDVLRGKNPFARMAVASEKTNQALLAGGVQTNDYLKQIRDLLNDRLPAKKKHASWDKDGDGIRDGSYEDQQRQKKTAAEKTLAEQAQQKVPGAKGGGLWAGAKGLWNKFRGKKNEDGEDDEGGGGGGDMGDRSRRDSRDATRRRRLARQRPGFRQTRGVWGKSKYLAQGAGRGIMSAGRGLGSLAGLGGGGLGMGAKLLGGAGAAYGAYSAYNNVKEGNYGAAALDAGLAGAGLAVNAGGIAAAASGIGAAASAVGGALAAGATAIAGVVSLPVLLGAAAVAAVGVGGYYAYKALTKRRLGIISRVRYVQYGFSPTDDDHVAAVFGLEDKLKPAIVYGKEGATLDAKKVDTMSLIKDFDVDSKNTKEMNAWLSWFGTRFKPVFLTHVSALKATAGDKWLTDVDKGLEPAQQLAYFNATKFPEGQYGETISPFKDLKKLPSTSGDVKAIIALAEIELKAKAKDAKGGIGMGLAATAAVASTMPIASPVAELNKPGADELGLKPNVISEVTKASGAMTGLSAKGSQTTLVGSSVVLESLGANRLDAIDAVRLKTYGLVKMETDKVRAVMILEKTIGKQISFNGGVANWTGSLEEILNSSASVFAVDVADEDQAKNWLLWFNKRFLPVYLNYATLIKAQTGKDIPSDGKDLLKPTQQLDLATALYTTSGVWQMSTSPWRDYELNMDAKSVDANLQGLKEMSKNAVLAQPGVNVANQPTAAKNQANSPSSVLSGAASAIGSIASKAASAVTSGLGAVWTGMKYVFGGGSSPSETPQVGGGGSTTGGAPAVGMDGGREIAHPGKGSGGDINSIPMPKGNKSWAALKDTILAASSMVGVDPKFMSVMAAIESGFDHTVKAPTSSARGLYQFIDSTWNWMLKRHGAKYGIAPNTPSTDPRANALMGAEYMKESITSLQGKLGRPMTDTDIYFSHFLGPGGAQKFLSADPNAIAASILPAAARANTGIFYASDKVTPLTVGQVYQLVNKRVKNKARQYGIGDGGEDMVASKPVTTAKATGDMPAAGAPAAAGAIAPKTAPAGAVATPSSQGIGATATAPPSTKAAATTTTTSSPSGSAEVPLGMQMSGFVPPTRMADVTRQAQMQSEIRISNLGETNQILSDSLTVLKDIASKIAGIASPAAASVATPTPVTNAPQRRTKDMPSAPVSVAKPAYPYQ